MAVLGSRNTKDGQGLNEARSGHGRSGPMNQNMKQVYSHDSGYDSSEDDPDFMIYKSHGMIIRNWFDGDGADVKPKYWNMRFGKQDNERNLIHRVISEMNARMTKNPPKPFNLIQALELVELLVLEQPELFTTQDREGKTPMFEAARSQIPIFFRVFNLLIPSSTVEKLEKGKKECGKAEVDCPLLGVAQGRLSQCTKNHDDGTANSPNTTDRRGRAGLENTRDVATLADKGSVNSSIQCPHGDIDVTQVLNKDRELRDTLSKILSDPQALAGCLLPLLQESHFDRQKEEGSRVIPLESFKALLQLCPDNFFTEPPSSGYTPLQQAIQLYDTEMIDYELLFSVIQALVARCPSSIFLQTVVGKEAKTAYRLLKDLRVTSSDKNSKSRSLTEQLLKKTCIGWRETEWVEKKKFLYWDAKSQQHFHLNLMGESAKLGKSYIDAMKLNSGMSFETVLDFVKLPYWKPEKAKSLDQVTQDLQGDQTLTRKNEQIDTDPYKAIFQWLWKRKVSKIFTVEVDDDGPEPHTNAAIREALRGSNPEEARDFEVEIWKWRKFDICSETVATAAPSAREVHLYSRGNTAVLRGWACGPGLGKLKHLQKLVIEIHPQNSNDDKDCEGYREGFKQHIRTQCPWLGNDAILFNNHHFQSGQGDNKGEGNRKKNDRNKWDTTPDEVPKSMEWLSRLSEFIQFMSNLGLSKSNTPSVKVALLDDGCKLENLEGTQKGESFRLDQEEFFVGPCSHGTEMARCIRAVCPMAELYIARLDDSRKAENQKFTIASCCEALRWAMEMEADVISMSWTFKRVGSQDQHEEEFVELVKQALSKNILLFGSLPDIPLAEIDQFAPVALDGVIKIGSATVFGESSRENKYAKPDFLLPGEEIFLSTNERARGSSFSTAYASGLAAMILYCLRAHRALTQSKEGDTMHKALPKAKTVDGMKGIFRRLGQNPDDKSDTAAFVQPYRTFGQEFGYTEDGRRESLDRIVNEITPSTVLRKFFPPAIY